MGISNIEQGTRKFEVLSNSGFYDLMEYRTIEQETRNKEQGSLKFDERLLISTIHK